MIEGQHTDYEWVIEPVDKYQDVIDPYHYSTLAEALAAASESALNNQVRVDIALKKDVWFDSYGVETRHYNYLHLTYPHEWIHFDSTFEDGAAVPKKYMKEILSYLDTGCQLVEKNLPEYVLYSLRHAYEYEEVV
tara:strand:+ start:183 stop:587 length:405 start_codon:yes stop_codon:yes gene_type:complete